MILGASPDSPRKLAGFRAKYGLPFTLLADTDHAIAEAFGAWQLKTFLGKKYMGVSRMTVIIDPTGQVAKVFEKASPAEHPAEVEASLRELRRAIG